jgi:ubiquinone/menaquinone biosynthesis C-methylase UbiE
LDVACGPGILSLKLAPHVKQVIGVDLTAELLYTSERKKNESQLRNRTFTRGDIEALGFEDESFDLVVCGSALHHFVEPAKAFQEMVRVLERV